MEVVLEEAGLCGKFQVCHVTLLYLTRFALSWTHSLMMFGLYNPGWRCVSGNLTIDGTLFSVKTIHATSSNQSSDNRLSSLLSDQYKAMYGFNMKHKFHYESEKLLTNNTITEIPKYYNGTCDIIKSCDATEFDSSSSTVVSEFGLVCDQVWIAYLIVSVLSGGGLVGSFVWGNVGERFGRKVVVYSSTLIMMVSCGLGVLSPNWEVYAIFTFFIGFSTAGVLAAENVLCMEFLTSTWRGRISSIPVWSVGLVSFAVATNILRDWKHIHLAAALVSGIAFLGVFWTPESIRWLVLHGKHFRAEKVVYKIAKVNRKKVKMESLKQLTDKDQTPASGRHYTYLDLFKIHEIRVLTLKVCAIRVISMCVYNIISFGIQALPGDFYTNIIFASVIGLPVVFISGPMANKLGRRMTGLLFSSVGAVCCIIITILLLAMEKAIARDVLVTSLAFITRSSMQGIVSFTMAYATELIPTAVRSLAFGFFNIPLRIVFMVGVFLIPRDDLSMIGYFCVLMVSVMAMTAAFWSLPETKNKPLKDTVHAVKKYSCDTDI